jgi:hypothetical protein
MIALCDALTLTTRVCPVVSGRSAAILMGLEISDILDDSPLLELENNEWFKRSL